MKKICVLLLLPFLLLSVSNGQDFNKAIEIVGTMDDSVTNVKDLKVQLTSLINELKNAAEENKKIVPTASAPQGASPVQMSGQMFAYYSYTTHGVEGKDFNKFDLDRLYLTAKAPVFNQGKFQLTTDIYRNTPADPPIKGLSLYGGLCVRIKFGYFDYAPLNNLSLKIGVIPTVWPGYVDTYWKYRGIASSMTDRNSYFSTADLGLSASYALPDKFGEVAGFVLNGSGYTSPELNRFKDVAVRLSVSPFADNPILSSLVVAGYYYKGSNLSTSNEALQRDRFGALVSYSYLFASIGSEYNIFKDAPTNPDTVISGNGFSVFGEIKAPVEEFKNTFSLVWRYDMVDPNTDKDLDLRQFAVFGATYKPCDKVTFALDYQWTKYESPDLKCTNGSKTDFDGRWYLHTIVSF